MAFLVKIPTFNKPEIFYRLPLQKYRQKVKLIVIPKEEGISE